MDILDLLSGPIAALPKLRDASKDFLTYLRDDVFEPYLTAIGTLNTNDSITASVRHHRHLCRPVCERLAQAVEVYLQGYPHLAYVQIEAAIAQLGPHFTALKAVGDMQKNLRFSYRIQGSDVDALDRGRLFHIPFELRHRVKTQRYSIPGLPSLYLGGSFYVCWEEYGRPPLDDLHVARFEAIETLEIINFGYHPYRMAGLAATMYHNGVVDPSTAAFVVAQAIAWPLIATCSIRVPESSVDFKAEYIVPQIVLQWVRHHVDFDGIRYFSTHVGDVVNDPSDLLTDPVGQVNYVFPVRHPTDLGYCDVLRSKFRLTIPFACRDVGNSVMGYGDCPHMNFRIRRNSLVDPPTQYDLTDLGQIQRHLATLPLDHATWPPAASANNHIADKRRRWIAENAYMRAQHDNDSNARTERHWYDAEQEYIVQKILKGQRLDSFR